MYQKLNEAEDPLWFLHAADLAVPSSSSELVRNQKLRFVFYANIVDVTHEETLCRVAFGSVFLHLAIHTPFSDVRRATTAVLAESVTKRPVPLNAVLGKGCCCGQAETVCSLRARLRLFLGRA